MPRGVPRGRGERILVCCAESGEVGRIRDALAGYGYVVTTAGDGEEALAKVASEKPYLIVLDDTLPRIDGYEMLKRLQTDADARDLPIIFLRTRDGWDLWPWDRGVSAYLTKPPNLRGLLIFIARIRTQLEAQASGTPEDDSFFEL